MGIRVDVSDWSDDKLIEIYNIVDKDLGIEEKEGNHLSDDKYMNYLLLYRLCSNELEKRSIIRFLESKSIDNPILDESLLGINENEDIDESSYIRKKKSNHEYQL